MPNPRKTMASPERRCAGEQSRRVLDLFAGAGGWEEGLRKLGLSVLGIEIEPNACATARAAGHERLQADVAKLDPQQFASVWGVVASPPCQAYSTAGKGLGRADKPLVIACAHELAAGNDSRAAWREGCRDQRSLLTVEPLRYALALRPRWVALEQVPTALELWSIFAGLLAPYGYHTAVGILSAERYGVPQTRKRAFLIASLDGQPTLPAPTHRSYNPRRSEIPEQELSLAPWVSMAKALDWNSDNQAHSTIRSVKAPAPTALTRGSAKWVGERPATTVTCDPRVHPPGHKHCATDPPGRYEPRRGVNAVHVTVCQAAILQGFRADYPWRGTLTRQFEQVGNAVPPPLAMRVLEEATRPSTAAISQAAPARPGRARKRRSTLLRCDRERGV